MQAGKQGSGKERRKRAQEQGMRQPQEIPRRIARDLMLLLDFVLVYICVWIRERERERVRERERDRERKPSCCLFKWSFHRGCPRFTAPLTDPPIQIPVGPHSLLPTLHSFLPTVIL